LTTFPPSVSRLSTSHNAIGLHGLYIFLLIYVYIYMYYNVFWVVLCALPYQQNRCLQLQHVGQAMQSNAVQFWMFGAVSIQTAVTVKNPLCLPQNNFLPVSENKFQLAPHIPTCSSHLQAVPLCNTSRTALVSGHNLTAEDITYIHGPGGSTVTKYHGVASGFSHVTSVSSRPIQSSRRVLLDWTIAVVTQSR
jgi:hypothetical protein